MRCGVVELGDHRCDGSKPVTHTRLRFQLVVAAHAGGSDGWLRSRQETRVGNHARGGAELAQIPPAGHAHHQIYFRLLGRLVRVDHARSRFDLDARGNLDCSAGGSGHRDFLTKQGRNGARCELQDLKLEGDAAGREGKAGREFAGGHVQGLLPYAHCLRMLEQAHAVDRDIGFERIRGGRKRFHFVAGMRTHKSAGDGGGTRERNGAGTDAHQAVGQVSRIEGPGEVLADHARNARVRQ